MHHCELCQKNFTEKYTLTRHQKSTKKCLKIQKDLKNKDHEIEVFKKEVEMLKADVALKEKQLLNIKRELFTKDAYLKCSQEQNKKLEDNIKILQDKLENIAIEGVKKSTKTNNVVNNLLPLTDEWLQQQAMFLSEEHVSKGALGYAEFAKNYSLKDRVECTDVSRRKLQYIDNNGVKIRDTSGRKLSAIFFLSIRSKNQEIIQQMKDNIMIQISSTTSPEECENIMQKMTEIINIETGIVKVSQGKCDELKDEFVKELCKLIER